MLVEMTIQAVQRMGVVAGTEPLEGRMVVLEALVGADGRPRLGALASLSDSIAGVHAFEVGTDVVPLTADLSVHLVGAPVAVGAELRASSRLLRQRRSGAVFEVEVHEAERPDHVVATSVVTYTSTATATGGAYSPEPHVGPWPDGELCASIDDLLPLDVAPDGALLLAVDEVTSNAVDILSGGAILMGADLAAERAARAALGEPCATTDMVVHFLAPGRVGPARIDASVLEATADHVSARLELSDTGDDDRLIASVTAIARRAGTAAGDP